MSKTDLSELRAFIGTHRLLTLAVSQDDEPFTALATYAPEPDVRSVLIHLSDLAPHKRMLLANPKCSVLIAEPNDGRAEPMSLARVTMQGRAAKIDKAGPEYVQAKARFLDLLPASDLMFSLPDFDLIRVVFSSGRFIAGFGKIVTFTAQELGE